MKTRNWIIVGVLILAAAVLAAAEGVITTQDGPLILSPANGRIGIGITNPGVRVHVDNGDIQITNTGSTGATRKLHVDNMYSSYGFGIDVGVENGGSFVSATYGTDPLYFKTGGTERMRITGTGNVGIGTASPLSEKLSVNGNIDMSGGSPRRIYMGGPGGADFGIAFSPYYSNYGIFYKEGSPDKIVLAPDGGGTASSVLVATGDGNVGIGTTSPKTKLDVNGGIGFAQVSGAASTQKLSSIRFTIPAKTYTEMEMTTIPCSGDCNIFISMGCRTNGETSGEARWIGQISGYVEPNGMEYADIHEYSQNSKVSFSMAYKDSSTISIKAKNTHDTSWVSCYGFYIAGPY